MTTSAVEPAAGSASARWPAVPCLTDELPPLNARRVVQVFYNYVRANPVHWPQSGRA